MRLSLLALCTLLSGCYAPDIEINEILNHTQCSDLRAGVQWVQPGDLAAIRGVTVLDESASAASEQQRLFAVSNGVQPTGGYALELARANVRDTVLTVEFTWRAPAPDSLVTQAESHPCAVIAIVGEAEVSGVDVLIGERKLPRLAPSQ